MAVDSPVSGHPLERQAKLVMSLDWPRKPTASDMDSNEAMTPPIHSLEDALDRCQALGMRVSQQRRSILELLWQAREHLSAREIYHRLNQQGKKIGHTSVYQNLEALSSQGIVECVERCDGRLYGHVSDSHSHVNCLDTHRIIDIYVDLPETLIQEVEKKLGVKITDYRIDFYGYQNPTGSPSPSTP